MKDVDLFAKMLELPKTWKVVKLAQKFAEKTITVDLELADTSLPCCPFCQNECGVYAHRDERVWRHLDTMRFKTFFAARIPRIKCCEQGVNTTQQCQQ